MTRLIQPEVAGRLARVSGGTLPRAAFPARDVGGRDPGHARGGESNGCRPQSPAWFEAHKLTRSNSNRFRL